MEKYLIILVIIFVLYYTYTCWTSNKVEGFADAQSVVGVDDANAINTLAGVAKKLQEGGLTIPGSLSATGEIRAGGMVAKNATFGDGAGEWAQTVRLIGGTKEPPYIDFLDKDSKRNTYVMGLPDKIYTPGSIGIGKDKIISGEGRLHVTGDELLYLLNKSGVIIGKEWGGNGNLRVQGNYYAEGDARPILTKVVTGGLAREIDTGVNHEQYPAVSMGGFYSSLDLEERDGGPFEFNTFKRDGRWWIFFNPRAQGNWHGGDKNVRARLTFFHKSMVQDDSPNWTGLHI